MNEQEFLSALSKCVRCGGCKANCPTYNASYTETESSRGRIRLLNAFIEGELGPSKKLNQKIFGCILCGECSRLCPLGIDIDEVFYYGRKLLRRYDRKRTLLRILSKIAFHNTDFSVRVTKPFHHSIHRVLVNKKIIPEGIAFRERPFKNTGIFKPEEKIGRVAVFTGCSVKHIYPELSVSLTNVLNAIHYEVVFPHTEVCCGAPFRALGMEEAAVDHAEKNFRLFENLHVDAIISLCPTCVVSLKKHYPQLIGKDLPNVYDVSTFLREKIKDIKTSLPSKIIYHDSCHLLNILNVEKQPRELIHITGATLMEPTRQTCCGFGGTFSISFKKLSEGILEDTCNELYKMDADAIATACPNCILQLSKSIKDIPIYHVIELIEESMC